MAIMGIDAVVYSAPDMDEARQFFADWGLKKVKAGKTGLVFETAVGSQIVVRPPDAKNLAAPPATGVHFREVIWGVSSKAHLNQIAKELSKDAGTTIDKDGTIHARDPNNLGIGFRLWTGKNKVKLTRAPVNSMGSYERIDKPSVFYERAQPIRMGHIVFVIPDLKAAEKFYTKRLGFIVSDRYAGDAAVFLRYAPRSDHHNMLFIRAQDGKTTDIHHVAFEVRDIHEVFAGGLHFSKLGHPTEVGPGRHPISSAYFWYFKNPCGGAVEYFTDSDQVTEKWKPTAYKVNKFSEWHLVDGIGDPNRGPSLAADAPQKGLDGN